MPVGQTVVGIEQHRLRVNKRAIVPVCDVIPISNLG
jgi:hypothetical protein